MKISFENGNGELTFVFAADELREGQKIIELFEWTGDADVARIMQLVEAWVQMMEHRQ